MNILMIGKSKDLEQDSLTRSGIMTCEASEPDIRRRLNHCDVSWVVLGEGQPEDRLFHLFTVCREAEERVKLAVLGPESDQERCRRWLRLGADVYLSSKTNVTRLVGSLMAADGYNVTVVERSFGGSLGPENERSTISVLSAREMEVLALVAEGLKPPIADRLFITSRTVAFHMSNVLAKLGARNRTHAVEVARLLGL